VVVLSGGNVDAGLLALVARRHETASAAPAGLHARVGPAGRPCRAAPVRGGGRGNLLAVEHVREAVDLQVRQTGVELTLETRGGDHADSIIAAMMATATR